LEVDELEEVLRRVLGAAQELTGARYAALGLLNDERNALALFLTVGIDEDERKVIGELPRGRGVLGELITHPRILRLDDLSQHPHSYGFPPGHPVMKTFLGAPIVIRGEVYGNVYMTDKPDGAEFDEADEELLSVLTEYAAIGIHHARRLDQLESRRDELERTVAALGATSEISRALAGEVDLDPILELVARRGRALVAARALVILLPHHAGLRVAHAAGELPDDLVGQTVAESSLASRLGLEADSGLYVPLAFRGRRLGMLVALDRLSGGPEFNSADEQLLTSFATTAAVAVGTAQALSAERRRERSAAAEAERRRWARELHDETLQGIAAVRVMLASSRRDDDAELRATVTRAADALQGEADRLRDIIHDVRPSSLDDLGLMAAMEALVARHADDGGPALQLEVDLDHEAGRTPERLHPDVETAIYRIAQEALTNALKHAEAHTVTIAVAEIEGEVGVRVRDDGRGYDPKAITSGFGLVSIHERVELLDGRLRVRSAPGEGTTLEARVPARHREPGRPASAR
ncbi:MAG TPA: GAF domain-containing sensor histidine kinase, partial [Methylomirabilota bacterium]|nr:GAF domain-containing sensor histidine kinase [Methylomirabilota bacterium]